MLAFRRLLFPSARSFSSSSRWTYAATNSSSAAAPALSEGEQLIHDKLAAKFAPSQLQVQDVSGE